MKRAKQAELAVGCCNHARTEEVKNYGGATIAIRCVGCTKILCEVGDCDGCDKKSWRLSKTISRTKERFCTDDCWSQTMKERRKEREIVVAVKPAGAP
jgi:hypothetical protein